MIKKIKNFYNSINLIEKSLFILFSLFPIAFILGNFSINLLFFLISIIFIIDTIVNKDYSFLKDPIFFLLIIFFLSLIINVFFSMHFVNSIPRVLKILLMILFVLQSKRYIQKYPKEFEEIIFGFWSLVFFIVVLDGIFEIIFGFNTLGFSTQLTGRIAGFFGEELVLGGFFFSFCLIFTTYIASLNKNYKKLILIIISLLIVVSFLIGERSNFIKVFLSLSFLSFFLIKLKLKYFITSFILLFSVLFLFINFNDGANNRYYGQIKKIYSINKINNYIKESPYGAHYNAAYKIFKEYPIFGIGIKNYRIESNKEKYKNDKYKWTKFRSTTHPHQIHYEFLSETGIFGYLIFLIFILFSLFLSIKNYLKYKNTFQLSGILYVIFSLTPILPSGSFFSTFASGLFWINYSIMVSYNKE
tara:strand:- start:295 stop:1542 length:1248 start_codon:yes stop_codon:yes gene_type:complete